MANFAIITDSACDVSAALINECNILYTPLYYTMGETSYPFLFGEGQPIGEYYEAMRQGAAPTTSAANPEAWTTIMEPCLARGEDVLVIPFSSGLSGTCASAQLAAGDLQEKYPDRKIFVVDSLGASAGHGLILYLAARKRAEGATIDQVRDWVEENRFHVAHWFTVDDLQYLKRGGRVSGATALVATVLNIKPVMHMDDEGHLISMGTVRGRKKALQALVEKMKETAIAPAEQTVFISHSDCEKDAEYVADLIREGMGTTDIRLFDIGPVVGAHTGPGTVALFFLAEHR